MHLPSLLLFHIGPVQSFIVSARRSRDLWFGSWMLSDLSKTAARVIADHHGIESLVFPAPTHTDNLNPESQLIVANKILAYVDGDLGDTPCKVDGAVRKRLLQIAGAAFDTAGQEGRTYFRREIAEAQIEDLSEIYWVALPCADRTAYRHQRDILEALMAARKNTRQFRQPTDWADMVPKSSLDGLRESVIDETLYDRAARDGEEGVLNGDRLYRLFKARRAERLSGVDLMKRLGNSAPDATFPSTSHVAALPVISRLKRMAQQDSRVLDWAKTYVLTLKTYLSAEFIEPLSGRFAVPVLARHDGSILYESRLSEDNRLTKEGLKAVRSALLQFLKDALGDGIAPSPYYMLLQGDGDRMGVVIDALADPDAHREFSQSLSNFSSDVRGIVEDRFGGALVYAGGDDVLAFLPLDTGLACAYTIAELFRLKMGRFADKHGTQPTFSAGLVIAHHLESLSQTMELARAAEKTAKAVDGKDALAITLSKRSGADRTIVGHWNALVPNLELLIGLVVDDRVPASAAYDLRSVAIRLDASNDTSFLAIQKKEIERILQRKRGQHGNVALRNERLISEREYELIPTPGNEDEAPRSRSLIGELLARAQPIEKNTVQRLADALIVADLLADAQTLSGVTLAELKERRLAVVPDASTYENGTQTEGGKHDR
jgi:CRISPR-associated protein Cmr2